MDRRHITFVLVAILLGLILLLFGKRPGNAAVAREAMPYPTDIDGKITFDRAIIEGAEKYANRTAYYEDIDQLVDYLDGLDSDTEKARAVYHWVCNNIEYDMYALENEIYEENPKRVFGGRKAICGGIAELYTEIMDRLGIETHTVIGHLKGYGYRPGDPLEKGQLHAWNAVRLEKGWILVDCTLGGGYHDALSGYIRAYDPYYFAPPPSEFIYTHFPRSEGWQLLENPVTERNFIERPILKRSFFKSGLAFTEPPSAIYKSDSIFTLVLKNAPKKRTEVRVTEGNLMLDPSFGFSQRKDDKLYLYADFPKKGRFNLELYINPDEGDFFDLAMVVGIDNSDGSEPVHFPEKMVGFSEMDVFVNFPIYGVLNRGERVDFSIEVDGVPSVAVSYGNDFSFLTDYGPYWGGSVTPERPGFMDIMIEKYDGQAGLYNSVLRYTVE